MTPDQTEDDIQAIETPGRDQPAQDDAKEQGQPGKESAKEEPGTPADEDGKTEQLPQKDAPEEEEEASKSPEEEEDTTEEPDEEKEPTEVEKEEPEEEEETTERFPDASSALVIELKPCMDPLAMTVNQAYWRSWSSDRPETCNRFESADIDPSTYTHLVYSFASISADGHLEPWVGSWDEVEKYTEFNKLKETNPSVKTIIAVTEGIFYGAGMNPVTFNEVAETFETRSVFAQSVISFLELYNFDGLGQSADLLLVSRFTLL